MNQLELKAILESSKSNCSKFSLIGQACKRGDLDWINQIIFEDATVLEKVYLFVNGLSNRPLCQFGCNQTTSFKGFSRGYTRYCSVACSKQDNNKEDNQELSVKRKRTLQERYGVESSFLVINLAQIYQNLKIWQSLDF